MGNNQIISPGIPYSFKRKMQEAKNKLFNFELMAMLLTSSNGNKSTSVVILYILYLLCFLLIMNIY